MIQNIILQKKKILQLVSASFVVWNKEGGQNQTKWHSVLLH